MPVRTHIAGSIRLLMAMFRLTANLETGFGKAILDILKRAYPGETIDVSPSEIGRKLMAIARRETQNNETRAQDVIGDYITYLVSSKWDERFKGDFPAWKDALSAIYTNVRRRAISESQGAMRKKKRTKSVDDAFGKRDEGGGGPEGGEGQMPTPDDNMLGKALDDQSSIREFYSVIDDYLPELRESLTPECLALFDLIMEDEVGGFGSDIQDNMNQASALKEKHPELFKKHEKRWSGFVGDTRKKLLENIWEFLTSHLTPGDFAVLRDTFFDDVDPTYIRRKEKEKARGKEDYQLGIDERKYSRLLWLSEQGKLEDKDQKEMDRLKKKIEEAGSKVEDIPAEEKPDAKSWKVHRAASGPKDEDLRHDMMYDSEMDDLEKQYLSELEESDEEMPSFEEWKKGSSPLQMRRDYGLPHPALPR